MPKLAKVHVKGEVHVLLAEVTDAEDVEADSNSDGDAAIVGPDSLVITHHELIEDCGDIDWSVVLDHPLCDGEQHCNKKKLSERVFFVDADEISDCKLNPVSNVKSISYDFQ